MNAISLFSSSGIGDLGLHANGIRTVAACELLPERAALFQANYPHAKVFCGDIRNCWQDISAFYRTHYSSEPFLVLATPPCQGMSSNGMGKMLSDYRKGIRPRYDERNRLIIPAVDLIKELRPKWVIFENVPNMLNTCIMNDEGEPVNIIEYIFARLGDDYVGHPCVVECADYGIAQHRLRLITILTRTSEGKEYYTREGTLMPTPTHSGKRHLFTKPWLTLRDAIGHLPPLRAEKGQNQHKDIPLHKVPLLDNKKLWWLDNTPEGDSAFNNQCTNPSCLYTGNTRHGTKKEQGINQCSKDTPLYCEKCGHLLPRPCVDDRATARKRIMKGYTSAYKRMTWDAPASTITQNFQYACSDNKVHPEQSRTLSLWEAMIIQTIADYDFSFSPGGRQVNDGLIRDTIGESVPPRLIDAICRHILTISQP